MALLDEAGFKAFSLRLARELSSADFEKWNTSIRWIFGQQRAAVHSCNYAFPAR